MIGSFLDLRHQNPAPGARPALLAVEGRILGPFDKRHEQACDRRAISPIALSGRRREGQFVDFECHRVTYDFYRRRV